MGEPVVRERVNRSRWRALLLLVAVAGCVPMLLAAQAKPAADPEFVIETAKGAIEIRLFRGDAPRTVEHLLALIRRSFYRGQRIHRVERSLVQFGDPNSRDMTRKASWGSGGSGTPINAFELVKKYTHRRGMVGMGHSGNPMAADSQMYIMKAVSPSLDGKYAIIGQVTRGMEVVDKLEVTDRLVQAYIKGEGPK